MKKSELKKYIADGGATLDARTLRPVSFSDGYQVTRIDGERIAAENARIIFAEIKRLQGLAQPGDFIGLWIDARGVCCVDLSEHIADLAEARRLQAERHQDDIYAWAGDLA